MITCPHCGAVDHYVVGWKESGELAESGRCNACELHFGLDAAYTPDPVTHELTGHVVSVGRLSFDDAGPLEGVRLRIQIPVSDHSEARDAYLTLPWRLPESLKLGDSVRVRMEVV